MLYGVVVSLANSYNYLIHRVRLGLLPLVILFILMYGVLPLLFPKVAIDIMFYLSMTALVLLGFISCTIAVSYFLSIAPLLL